jgi:hypothetical protein
MEQLQRLSGWCNREGVRTVKVTAPQWQLPWYEVRSWAGDDIIVLAVPRSIGFYVLVICWRGRMIRKAPHEQKKNFPGTDSDDGTERLGMSREGTQINKFVDGCAAAHPDWFPHGVMEPCLGSG